MLLYILTWIIIYFTIFFIIHNLYLFFQKNLTTAKTLDFYNYPKEEYDKINSILNSNQNKEKNDPVNNQNIDITNIQNNDLTNNFNLNINNTSEANIIESINFNNKHNNLLKNHENLQIDIDTFNNNFESKKNIISNINNIDNIDNIDNNKIKNELTEFLTKLNT